MSNIISDVKSLLLDVYAIAIEAYNLFYNSGFDNDARQKIEFDNNKTIWEPEGTIMVE